MNSEVESLKFKIRNLETIAGIRLDMIDACHKDLDEARAKIATLEIENSAIRKQCGHVAGDRRTACARIADLEQELKKTQETLQVVREHRDVLIRSNRVIRQSLQERTLRLRQMEEEKKNLQALLDDAGTKENSKIQEYAEEIRKQAIRIWNLEAEVECDKTALKNYDESNTWQADKLAEKEREITELRRELKRSGDEIVGLRQQLVSARKNFATAENSRYTQKRRRLIALEYLQALADAVQQWGEAPTHDCASQGMAMLRTLDKTNAFLKGVNNS